VLPIINRFTQDGEDIMSGEQEISPFFLKGGYIGSGKRVNTEEKQSRVYKAAKNNNSSFNIGEGQRQPPASKQVGSQRSCSQNEQDKDKALKTLPVRKLPLKAANGIALQNLESERGHLGPKSRSNALLESSSIKLSETNGSGSSQQEPRLQTGSPSEKDFELVESQLRGMVNGELFKQMFSLDYRQYIRSCQSLTIACNNSRSANSNIIEFSEILLRWCFLRQWGGNTNVECQAANLGLVLSILQAESDKSSNIAEGEVQLVYGIVREALLYYPLSKDLVEQCALIVELLSNFVHTDKILDFLLDLANQKDFSRYHEVVGEHAAIVSSALILIQEGLLKNIITKRSLEKLANCHLAQESASLMNALVTIFNKDSLQQAGFHNLAVFSKQSAGSLGLGPSFGRSPQQPT